MQNFTLGKKGISMLFFTFFLLTSSFSSFAQENCPTVTRDDDATETGFQQNFCYLATVSDLEANANGDAVRWYRTATSTNPIPEDELLQTETYYAGNASGTCTNRVPVDVTIDDAGAPTTQFGNTFAPCEYDEADTSTVQDLIDNVDASTEEGETEENEIEIFDTEFGETALDPNTRLIEGNSYFAGQINRTTGCRTSRLALRYDPVLAIAPTGEAEQQFCNEATVADLVAEATSPDTQAFRWYSTATSSPALSSTTPLIDGETYYASQIVNRSNSNLPPCESTDRFAVTVSIQEPVDLGAPAAGIVCESDVQETFPDFEAIENFYLSLLPEGTPTNGTFDPTAEEIAQIYQNDEDGLGDFTTTYTVGIEGCESSVELTITVIAEEEANAGTIEDILVECGDEDVVILDDSLLSEDATTGGTFSGEGVNEDGNFDPAIGPGTYTITYSVDDSADCVIEGTSDSTTFTITVQGSELGEPIVLEMCITEVQDAIETPADFEAFFNNILAENGITNFDGTFDPSENVVGTEIFAYINSDPTAPETFNITYTVTSVCGEESVDIALTINNTEEPNAGEINAAPVCSSATLFDLNSLLGNNNNPGGTFSNEDGVIENGLFDVSQTGSYPITYTVTENPENCTAGEPDSTEFTLMVNEGIVAESPEAVIVCESDVQELFPSNDEIRKFYVAIAKQAGFPTNGTLNPTAAQLASIYQNDDDGLGDFTTTYTFGEGDCKTSVELTVTVIPVEDANAGTIEDINVPCESTDIVILDDSRLSDDATTGGTFSGEGINEDGNFDPSVGPGNYVITYSVDENSDCVTPGTSDSTTFNIVVGDGSDQVGTPIEPELCITEVVALLADPTAAITYFNDLVADLDPALDGDFTVEPSTLGVQILGYVNNPTTPSQTFSTNYTYASTCGNVSTDISLTINNTTPADAGEIADFSLCQNDENFDLFTKLTDDNPKGGTFSDDSGVIENGLFDISATGVYTITYTVSEDDLETCLSGSDSTEFDLTVTENTIVIGNSNIGIVCEADVQTLFPSVDEIRKYLISLLDPGVSKTSGTFSPTAAQLAQIYQNDEDGIGDFKTKYTIVDGTCSSSVELTIRILESLDSPIAENPQLFCSEDNPTVEDLEVTGTNVMWFANATLTTPLVLTDSLVDGDYYAVSVSEDENVCNSLPTTVSVSIISDAPAPVAEAEQDFCSVNNPTVENLDITGDNITVYEDAELTIVANNDDLLVDGEDYYAIAFCGTESTMITVTVGEKPEAPVADANQSFCLIDNPTVDDISVTGDNVVIYEDEALTEVATSTDPLANEAVYYAAATNNSCKSDAVMITILLTDGTAPTLQTDGNEFCRSENPTIQDLIDNLSGSGIQIYQASTGGTALAASTALIDGTTYFASGTNDGCESSERLGVQVEVAFCGIPEAFSPNGDNINDQFVIPDIATDFPNYTIEIFNRWGNVVFKGNSRTGDWDGISNQSGTLGDNVLAAGVYFYILNYNDGQTEPVQGKVYLSR